MSDTIDLHEKAEPLNPLAASVVRAVLHGTERHVFIDGRELPHVLKFTSQHDEDGEPFVTVTFKCEAIVTEHVRVKR